MNPKSRMIRNVFLALGLISTSLKGQLSGVYTIPGSYASIAAVITDLNTQGVSGPVTINIAAGYLETAITGGYTLNAIAGASSVNNIVFQKSGVGANPLITAYTGTATPSSATQDGVWRFSGTDFVTIDGISIVDPNNTNPATMEFGFGFFKASATDGCQNNIIRNCVITLSRVNNAAGSGPASDGSRGIDVVASTSSAHTTALTITSSGGANSNNKFYSNTIQNCNVGIAMIGFADSSPFANADSGNDIGGSSALTGNTIINFGGGGTSSQANGVRTSAQYGLNISFNTINNNNGSGVNHNQVLKGILVNSATSANTSINNNTVTLSSGGSTQALTCIENNAGSTPTTNTVNINNNLITGCTYAGATSAAFNGIMNFGSASVVNINGNFFSNNSIAGTTSTGGFINNSGAASIVININNNGSSANSLTFTGATSGSFNFIYNASGASTATLNILNNDVQGITYSTTASGAPVFLFNGATTITQNINNNTFTNLVLNTTGSVTFISNNVSVPAASTQNINGNSIVTGFNKTGAGGTVTFYTTNAGSASGSICNNNNNNFSNITLTGATTMAGWVNTDGGSPAKSISNNVFTNWTCGTSAVTGINNNFNGNNSAVTSNTISNITGGAAITGITRGSSGSGAFENISSNVITNLNSIGSGGAITGINIGASSIGSLNISNNTIGSFSTTAGSQVAGIVDGLGNTSSIFANKIYDLVANNSAGTVNGIRSTSGTQNIYNNLIGDLKTPLANAANPLIGINLTGGTSMNLNYNTVYLNGTSSGAQFGSSAILASTTPNLILRNNAFVNLSTAVGTGSTVAFRRSSTTLTSYQSASNNNLFYAGAPSASNLIFNDGTNSSQTLAAFKTLMVTRDGVSITENPTFTSVNGSTSNFLGISTSVPTQIESAGVPVSGITVDFAGTVRNTLSPDIGAWEGNYILNDIAVPQLLSSNFTTGACILTGRTFTAAMSDASGLGTGLLAPRLYYKINAGSYSSVAGTLASGTASNGVWSFNMVYSASANDVVSYFLVAQDAALTPNLVSFPGTGFAGTDVNTITTPPTAPNSYVVGTLSGVYTVGALGTFTSLTAAAFAYNTYCLNGPVTFSLTDALYSTSETFPIVFQRNIQASATNSLLIIPASGVSVVITPTVASLSSIVKFLDARYITINGINASGSSLNINNSSASGAVANIWLASSNTAGGGNSFITVRNTNINGISTSNSNGIISSVDGLVPSATGGSDNDNITVSNNTVLTVYNGILAVGSASVSTGGLDNWSVTGNVFGPSGPGATNIGGTGVTLSNAVAFAVSSNTVQNINTSGSGGVIAVNSTNFSVTANTIQNFTTSAAGGGFVASNAQNFVFNGNTVKNFTTSASAFYGVNLNSGCIGFSVAQNTITSLYSSASSSGVNAIAALYLGSAASNGTVNMNVMNTMVNTSTSGYGAKGVIVNTGNISNTSIRNNFISDIYCFVDVSAIYWPVGILVDGSSGGLNIDFNSINIFGQRAGYSSAGAGTGAAALLVASSSGSLNVRNNVFSCTYDNTTQTTDLTYAIYSAVGASNFTSIDYNDYYVGGTNTNLHLGYLGSNRTTLYDLQANFGFGQNLNSVNFQPQFVSNTDLHKVASAVTNAPLNNSALPLSGVLTDIDNTVRSITPDMGADEFNATGTCTSAVAGTLLPSTTTLCTTQTLLASPANISSGIGTTYQWKISITPGGPYTNAGTSITSFSALNSFAPGVYYVVFQSSCPALSLTGTSNESTLTVLAPPNSNIVASNSVVCQGSAVTLSASGTGSSYLWSTGATASSISINPSATTPYSLTVSNGACATTSTINMLFSTVPTITVTPATQTVCSNVQATLSAIGANTYSWSNGSTGPVITPTQSANINYTVVGTNAAGCASAPVVRTVSVLPSPSVSIVGSSGICTGQNASLTASGAITYSWNTGALTNTLVEAPTSNTVYIVTGSDGICSTTVSQSVAVAASLSITISGSPSICIGQTANLTANGGVTYVWSNSATTSTIAPAPTSNTTYSVVGSSGTCSNSAVINVTVNPLPTVSITGNTLICPGITTTLAASGASTYVWSNSATASSITAAPTNTTSYSVTGTSSLGCVGTNTITVATNTVPVISIVRSSTVVCLNSSATFTASGANTYTWNPVGIQAAIVTVTPTGATVYTASGTNAAGCIASATTSLAVNSLPNVVITPASATVCSLSNLNLLASGATTYTWNGNTAITTAAVSFSPSGSTVYTVVGTNANGCVNSRTVAVTTNSLPVMSFVPASATVCALSPVTFTVSGAATYFWNNNNNTTTTSTFFPASNSIYTVTGATSLGCQSTATVMATALPLPSVLVSPSFTTVCIGSTNSFTASGAVSYTWNGNQALTGSVQAIATPSATSYTIDGTGANGCVGSSQFVVLTNPLPVISIAASSPTVCSLQPVQLVANGASTYTWSSGGVVNDSTIVNPLNNTTYTVTGTDGVTGCEGTQTIAIVTSSLPAIAISPASPTVCVKTPVTLSASGGLTYSWSNGLTSLSIPVTPTANVSYTLTGTDASGCTNIATVTIVTNPLPVILVTPATQTVCEGETATFVASGANTYTWSVNSVTSATLSVIPTFATFYSVTGVDVNNCKSTGSATIGVSPCTGIASHQLGNNAVTVFPNPSTGFFTTKFEFEGEKTIVIMNAMGQVIETATTDAMSRDFDLGGLSKGVYFVNVSSKLASGNYKIVID